MKRFDKRYIYASLITDLIGALAVLFIFVKDFFLDEESRPEDVAAATPYFVIGFIALYLILIVYRILYYRTSGYELTKTELRCKRGVLFRKRSLLEYKKMHAINKKQNLVHRIFGIAVLTVDSGSANTAHQAEITIIERDGTVDALLRELNALKACGTHAAEEKEELLLSDKDCLFRFTSGRKVLYSLINVASSAFFTALFGIAAILLLGICKWMLRLDALGTWGQYFLFAILITLGAMLLTSAFSMLGCLVHSFVGYYNFTISKQGENIQISYGLLEKHTNTFSYDRIKAVRISQGLVQRMLGFASIRLEVIGYTEGGEDNNTALGVLVPFCRYREVGEILCKVLPDFVPDEKETRAVSYFPFVSWFTLILATVTGIILPLSLVCARLCGMPSKGVTAIALAILGAAALILAVKLVGAALALRNNGLAVRDGRVTAYYGGFTRNVTVFMTKNLIAAEHVTTPLRKRAGIATLVMHLKTNALSNEIKVRMQREQLARELEQLLTL